jgi:hypothetical protein
MAAASAIVSGVIVSILSYRNTKQLETMKNRYNYELEEAKRKNTIELEELKNAHSREIREQRMKAEHRKEEEFNSRIRELVLLELKKYSNLLDGLLHTAEAAVQKYKSGWEVVVKTPSRYTSISLERWVSIFNPRALTEVEGAYYWFAIFKEGFLIELDRYLNRQITIEQLRDILAVEQKKLLWIKP